MSSAQREVKELEEQRYFVRESLPAAAGRERRNPYYSFFSSVRRPPTPAFRGRCLPSAFFGLIACGRQIFHGRGRIRARKRSGGTVERSRSGDDQTNESEEPPRRPITADGQEGRERSSRHLFLDTMY